MSIRDQLQLLHSSQDRVEGTLWNRLFTNVSTILEWETKIRLKTFLTVQVPNYCPSLRQSVARYLSNACSSGTGLRMARQYYSCRIQVVPTRAPTVGQLLTKTSVEYTPSSLRRRFVTGCRCSTSNLCWPNPLNHVIIRPHDPLASGFIPDDPLPVWRQCILNATFPSPELCYKFVASSVTTALKSNPGENQVSIVDHATHLASLASDNAELGMNFGDPRCMPNHIGMLQEFLKIDKSTGTCLPVCEVLWAQLFVEQFLMSSQYQIIRQCDTIDEAKSELMDLIEKTRTELSIPTHLAKHA